MAAVLLEPWAALAALISLLFWGPPDTPVWTSPAYSAWLFPSTFASAFFYSTILICAYAAAAGRNRLLWCGILGAALGVTFLAHAAPALIAGPCVLIAAVGCQDLPASRRTVPGSRWPLDLALILVVALLVSLPLTWSIAGHYHLRIVNRAPNEWTWGALESLPAVVRGSMNVRNMLSLFGLVILVRRASTDIGARLVIGWVATAGILFGYGYVQRGVGIERLPPLLPQFHFFFYLRAAGHLLTGLGAWTLVVTIDRRVLRAARPGRAASIRFTDLVMMALTVGFSVFGFSAFKHRLAFQDERAAASMVMLHEFESRVVERLRRQTPVDSVVLASPEDSLREVGPAGRLVVGVPAPFSNPYVDFVARARAQDAMIARFLAHDREQFDALAGPVRRYPRAPRPTRGRGLRQTRTTHCRDCRALPQRGVCDFRGAGARRLVSARSLAGCTLLLLGAVALALGTWVVLTGGATIHAGGLRIASRGAMRPVVFAVLAALAGVACLAPDARRRLACTLVGGPDQRGARVAQAAAVLVFLYGVGWNTRAVGGSDSSCYVVQADAFLEGHAVLPPPFPDGVLSGATPAELAPAGFIPSKLSPTSAVPICGPGLALIMAGAALVASRGAVFLVTPVCAALCVWLTFVLGRRMDDEMTGAAAAVLLACSPIFLFQAVQPMSDVPAAACWLAALTASARSDRRGQIVGGFSAALAVIVRANLAPLVVTLVALLRDRRAVVRFAAAALPGLVILAWLNEARYGSPLVSGYGGPGVLFAWAHLVPNLARYPRWILETQTPLPLLAFAAPWSLRQPRGSRRLVAVSLASIVLVLATYLAYTVFDDWWYIRFLIPALPLALVLAVASVLRVVRGAPRRLAVLALCAGVGAWSWHVCLTLGIFDLQAIEARFVVAGEYVNEALPRDAVILAGQESGGLRHYARLPTIGWGAVPEDLLDRRIAELLSSAHPAYFVLEESEEPLFRQRFAGQRFGALDWPPRAEIHALVKVRVYAAEDRGSFLGGGTNVQTRHIWPTARSRR